MYISQLKLKCTCKHQFLDIFHRLIPPLLAINYTKGKGNDQYAFGELGSSAKLP